MAFKEKIAWLSLVAMIVTYSIYFALAAPLVSRGDATTLRLILLLGALLTAQVVVMIIATIAIAVHAGRREATAPADERDRAIARRGAATAYYVLLVGTILVGCVMPFKDKSWVIINAALFVLLVAEVTRYGTIVASYRRGWHG
jgi:hypothetical protein